MPVSLGLVTVRTALPFILPDVALMVALPAVTALARPLLEIFAAAVLLLDQITFDVQSELVPFE